VKAARSSNWARTSRDALEQRVGVLELHLAGGVVDRVVRAGGQERVAHINALAALADLGNC